MKLKVPFFLCLILVFLAFWQCKNEPHPVLAGTDTCSSVPLSDPGVFISKMPQPVFSEKSGPIAYGTKVLLHADSLPAPGVYEMSTDLGKTWKALECTVVSSVGEIWGRTRYKNIVSPVSKVSYSIFYKKVLIVGNSITLHGQLPQVGWYGNWGMAASAADKDYVHLVSAKLKKLNPNVEIRLMIAVDFEQNYRTYDFTSLKNFTDFAPDMVIMRIAENTNLTTIADYENRYDRLITELISKSTVSKVICSTSFWSTTEEASWRIRNIATNRGYIVADLEPLWKDKDNSALANFTDTSVGRHPSDKGMQAIADIIGKHF
ncbi:SGNH/GDSL hydrolase family protein [Dyadobacter sp. CY312]|uniref:SGNH/GDSL hydrolase family protein n=1 Tax=Dyadobacter sp. CY312 TaxID=2907303 RepID=UPI001F461DB4|nr:SGNH/GDSL hydrolase family protein [Dyadobacter sp. CY312]MCE7039371.1 SGNH/GDSL hydrolase family protein [Dyadobacter sp. CY312]